jgi:hypothetical protein
MAPDGNLIAAQGDAINSDPNRPSELVEFTPEGGVRRPVLDRDLAGRLLRRATSSTKQQFAAVNDITNTNQIWIVTK